MRTKRFLTFFTILSAIASISIIGTGFGAWYFGSSSASKENNVNVVINDAYEFCDYKIYYPNIYYIESNLENLSTYGGLVFYNTDETIFKVEGEGSGELNYTLTSSVMISFNLKSSAIGDVASKDDAYFNALPDPKNFSVKLNVSLSGHLANWFTYTGKEDYIFEFQKGNAYEITSHLDYICSNWLNLNDKFELKEGSQITNEDGIIDLSKIKDIEDFGKVNLTFTFISNL